VGDLYTVLRVLVPDEKFNDIRPCLAEMFADVEDGRTTREPTVFSYAIVKGLSWYDHHESIIAFLKQHGALLRTIHTLGGEAQFDVAVWPDERFGYITTCLLSSAIMSLLKDAHVEMLFSVYWSNSGAECDE
jgi:hypothetical protein